MVLHGNNGDIRDVENERLELEIQNIAGHIFVAGNEEISNNFANGTGNDVPSFKQQRRFSI